MRIVVALLEGVNATPPPLNAAMPKIRIRLGLGLG